MKLLLHICCAPCSVACVQSLRAEGIEPVGYWYNPTIHPFTEYRQRRDTLTEYAQRIGMELRVNDEYGLRPFVDAVAGDIAGRCATCYAARMRETARYAAENGFTHFTSTLFISPYQKHELLRAAAEEAAEEFGVAFLYRDFRPLFRQGQAEARELGLYMQKYCGCVFSEEERYSKAFQKRAKLAVALGLSGDASTAARPAGRPEPAAQAEAAGQTRARLRRAGMRFERMVDMELGEPKAETEAGDEAACVCPGPGRELTAALADQTVRALWEVRNVLRCLHQSGLWESPFYCVPAWRHAYHMLHSLDRWYINPERYAEPPIHLEGLNDLERPLEVPALSIGELEAYLAQTAVKIRRYLRGLNDAQLTLPPEGCEHTRMALIVGQLRHLQTHMGMLMGWVIEVTGEWPQVIGMQGTVPTEDDGAAKYDG